MQQTQCIQRICLEAMRDTTIVHRCNAYNYDSCDMCYRYATGQLSSSDEFAAMHDDGQRETFTITGPNKIRFVNQNGQEGERIAFIQTQKADEGMFNEGGSRFRNLDESNPGIIAGLIGGQR